MARSLIRVLAMAAALGAGMAVDGAGAQELELLRRPANSAITVSMGQGLDLIRAAEPLGASRFRVRLLNRSYPVTVPELGKGTIYTGNYGIAYGFNNAIDVSLGIPFLMDSAGGLNKYGTGDPVLGIKWARPPRTPATSHAAVQVLLGLPLGYKGEHALDKVGGIRQFSSGALDLGFQLLQDIHFQPVSLYLNAGLFRPGNPEVVTQMVYGLGAEWGRRNRWLSLNCEYQARVAFAQQARAANVLKFGARVNVFRGVELELNREFGFLEYPTRSLTTFGVRTHGYLTGRRRLESRYSLYQPPPPVKRAYEPDRVLRLAVVNYAGFEEYRAGERLVEKLRTRLAPHDSIEVVDLSIYRGIPRTGTLNPRQALDLAHRLGVDVVITGTVETYEVDRFAGPTVPLLFEVPRAGVRVGLRYRVMWFADAARADMELLTEEVSGQGWARQRVRLLPADRQDITVGHTAKEIEMAHDVALEDLVTNMLASLAAHFSWVPPDFQYAKK
ncbi:MAG: hypothetical protein ABIL09_06675 [Gemmatimonadota bacterium]